MEWIVKTYNKKKMILKFSEIKKSCETKIIKIKQTQKFKSQKKKKNLKRKSINLNIILLPGLMWNRKPMKRFPIYLCTRKPNQTNNNKKKVSKKLYKK